MDAAILSGRWIATQVVTQLCSHVVYGFNRKAKSMWKWLINFFLDDIPKTSDDTLINCYENRKPDIRGNNVKTMAWNKEVTSV